ncbi:MAG: putative lipid II flippase FtsW [Gammaproteobacteria bacterium]
MQATQQIRIRQTARTTGDTPLVVVDVKLLVVALLLLIVGLVMVGSASISIADKQLSDPFYYFYRQLSFAVMGIIAAYVVFKIPLSLLEVSGPWLIIASMILLVMVFIPGLGREVNGSIRWLQLGPISLQASELVKLFVIIYLSGYLVRHNNEVRTYAAGFIKPMAVLSLLALLLLFEPDYGAVAVMMVTATVMLWLAGARIFQFVLLVLSLGLALSVLAVSSPYRMERLTTFLNPWADPFDSGFQLTQALIAFGRGEWFGVGLGSSVQKLFYLPEAHTDFMLAVLAEEMGLIAVLIVISLYCFLVLRSFRIGRMAEERERPFAGYLAYGVGIWIGLQAFINIGVNMGVLPTKGLTLPLMSYGGSSLIIMCVAVALLLRVDFENRNCDRVSQHNGGKPW